MAKKKFIVLPAIEVLSKWAELARTSPYSSFFQSPEAFELYSMQPYLDTFALGVMEGNKLTGVVVGYIQAEKGLKKFFSRRAIVNGGVLVAEDVTPKALEMLLKAVIERTKDAIYLEFRNHHHYKNLTYVFKKCGFGYEHHLNVKITCDNREAMFKRLDKNRKRELNRKIPKQFYCGYVTEPYYISVFYEMLRKHYKEKVRKPLFPYYFFESLVMSRLGKLLILFHGRDIVGGMVQVFLPGKVVYDYYSCAVDTEFKGFSPSVLLYWKTMLMAAEKGIPMFDTMGAGKPKVPYGVRDFKQRFGGELVQEGRFQYIHKPFLYKLGVWYINMRSKE